MGLALEGQKRLKEARQYFWKGVKAARQCDDPEGEAHALSSLGSGLGG
jgi:hypothetical protein